jgi:hypothetical protein
MRIVLENYDDRLEVVTSLGTSIHIRPVEIKKQLGVAGTTDQLVLTAKLPVRVGKPFKSYDDEDTLHVLVGTDHWAEVEPTDLKPDEDCGPEEFADWLLEIES